MNVTFLISLLFMAYCKLCHASQTLSSEQSTALNAFFRFYIKDSEGGYVLYDAKPISIEGIRQYNILSPETNSHKRTVVLKEGIRTWNQLEAKSKKIIIHSYHKNDLSVTDCKHVLFINKHLLQNSIRKNLPLFQYVLGPKVTPKGFLEALISPNHTFHELLKNDQVLIGIILGFGTENSIHCGRTEKIDSAIFSYSDRIPFQSKLRDLPELYQNFEQLLLFEAPLPSDEPQAYHVLEPSFGFKSIQEEYTALESECAVSSEILTTKTPNYIFGCLPKRKETQKLLKTLESSQEKSAKLLESPTFLADVLKLITGKDYIIEHPFERLPISTKEIQQIDRIAAKEIWIALSQTPPLYNTTFLDAFDNPKEIIVQDQDGYLSIDYTTALHEAQRNLQEANKEFKKIASEKDWTSIVPQKLCYRKLEAGSGKQLEDETTISLNYKVFDPHGSNLTEYFCSVCPTRIDLSTTIPGFAHGIKGMRIGETREILIHPSLAYGATTKLERCIYLRAIVTLTGIEDKPKKSYPLLVGLELSFLLDPAFEKECETKFKNKVYFDVDRLVTYLSKSDVININAVRKHLRELKNGDGLTKGTHNIMTPDEEIAINRVHWNIYFGTKN